jgi:hypothetical protein
MTKVGRQGQERMSSFDILPSTELALSSAEGLRASRASTFGPAYEREHDGLRLRTQLEVIRDVMLSAAECGAWLTLRELAGITRFGEASISAQLRHLRKPPFGSYLVEKRRRGNAARGVWEYRLGGPRRVGAAQMGLLEPQVRERG